MSDLSVLESIVLENSWRDEVARREELEAAYISLRKELRKYMWKRGLQLHGLWFGLGAIRFKDGVYKAFDMDVNDDSIYESDKFMEEVNGLIDALKED